MKIAIHHRENSFSKNWIQYCKKYNIPFKLVDCYKNDIIDQLRDCDALFWHFHQLIPADTLFARQLLYSLECSGKYVFPDFNTMWHFDDKVGQKYLFEAIGAPLVQSYIFYSKSEAKEWIKQVEFPKVFKLRLGASSSNVFLVKTQTEARKLINQAFGRGFAPFNSWIYMKENIRKYKLGRATLLEILKSVVRLVFRTEFLKFSHNEKGYIYFQDFIPNNDSDIRVVIVDNKAFGFKRFVRKNDFRASGSKMTSYNIQVINVETLKVAFSIYQKLKLKSVAYDFIYKDQKPLLVEVSFSTTILGYKPCPGYWDKDMNFHEGEFDFCGWMIEEAIREINEKNNSAIQN